MDIKKVVVAGGGVLGTQIAFLCAYWGYDTTIWLRSQGSIGRTKPKIELVRKEVEDDLLKMKNEPEYISHGLCPDKDSFDYEKAVQMAESAYQGLKLELDLDKAFGDADLVIESMSEDKDAKKAFYKLMAPHLPAKTILCTNSSTMLPSTFAKFTGRPDKYLALHFANHIWHNNTAEVMAQKETDPKVFETVMAFARSIHMVALPLHKEKSGYLLNSMLVPFLFAGLDLVATGVSDPESVDKAWVLGTGAPEGPFQILDVVGMKTAYEIVSMYLHVPSFLAPYHFKDIAKMLKKMIDEGKLGVASGEGFYKYDKK